MSTGGLESFCNFQSTHGPRTVGPWTIRPQGLTVQGPIVHIFGPWTIVRHTNTGSALKGSGAFDPKIREMK